MRTDSNNYSGPDRRLSERRMMADRRTSTRFSDELGRRSGIERRLPIRVAQFA